MAVNPAKQLLHNAKKQHTTTQKVIEWDTVADDYKANRSWILTAQAQGLTVAELNDAFNNWEYRPDNISTLKQWAPMLQAQAQTEHLRALQKVSESGSRAALNLLKEEREGKHTNLVDLLPTCCPASQIFRGGWSIEEARTILSSFPCDNPEACRVKALLVEKMHIRDMQSTLIANGNTKMLTFAAENILHQGTGGEAEFNPALCEFVVQVE